LVSKIFHKGHAQDGLSEPSPLVIKPTEPTNSAPVAETSPHAFYCGRVKSNNRYKYLSNCAGAKKDLCTPLRTVLASVSDFQC